MVMHGGDGETEVADWRKKERRGGWQREVREVKRVNENGRQRFNRYEFHALSLVRGHIF